MVTAPVLTPPRFDLDFIVDTDASGDGVGAVLSQRINGREHIIAYASRVLSRAERRYCATQREMLALVWAARHFRLYLYGKQFLVCTDHNSLCWLHNFKEPEGLVARWLEILSEFDYRVEHCPGLQHANADSLSRRECRQCGESIAPCVEANASITMSASLLPAWSTKVNDLQMKEELCKLMEWLQKKSIPEKFPRSATSKHQTLWNQRKQLTLVDSVLYRRWENVQGGGAHRRLQLVLPASLVHKVLTGVHNSPAGGHMGVKKTLEKIRLRFYWPR